MFQWNTVWFGGITLWCPDLWSRGYGFHSRLGHYQVDTS